MIKASYNDSAIAIDTLLHMIKDKSDYTERPLIHAYTVGYLNSLLIEIYMNCPEARDIIKNRTEGKHRNLADLYEAA